MKSYFIALACIIGFSCKSGKKESTNIIVNNDSVLPLPPADPPPGVEIKPAGTDMESFGEIKLGMAHSDVLKVLGNPDIKSKPIEWGADGLMHEDWTWKKNGLVLNMTSESDTPGSLTTFSITAKTPCTFKTAGGIGIGNTAAEVQFAYKNDINKEESSNEQLTVGSIYGGILFGLKNDKVVSIFVGAAAE